MAGFRSPVFILGLSAVAAATQGGFRTPIPPLNIGTSSAIAQVGFVTPIPVLRMGAPAVLDVIQSGNGKKFYVAGNQYRKARRTDEEEIFILTRIIGDFLL